jgi:hypothetical protein
MATEKQLNYFRNLLRKNGIDPEDYDLFEEIPHRIISPILDEMKHGRVMTASEWTQKVSEFKPGTPNSTDIESESGEKYDFKSEIGHIKSIFMQNLVKAALTKVPEYFWHVPASSTGKYHPEYALGDGGLLRHTRAAIKIALALFENPAIQRFDQDEKDIIIAALILHDTVKHGLTKQEYTVTEHPMLVEKLFDSTMLEGSSDIQKEMFDTMIKAIRSHMGPWNTDKFGNEIMPKPETALERFVHLCDYLASRRFLEVNFLK